MGGLRKDYWERVWEAPSLGRKDAGMQAEHCESREGLGKLGM